MRLDDYDFKNISELYLEDLIYILHPSWALSQLEWDETLGSKYSTSAYCSFGCNGNLISHLKNGQCVFVKSFSTLQEIFGVLDHNGYPRWDLPFFLKARLESLIEGSIKRPATGGYYPNSELLEGNNQQSGLIVGGVQAGARTVVEKKYTEINSPTIEEMLVNPELDGINSVALHPVSLAVESVVDLIDGAKEFVSNPSLGGVAAMAVTAISGKYADKIADELPLKKLDKAMAKRLHTMKRFKVPCFKPGKTIKGTFKGKERELESHFSRQLKNQESGLNDLTVGEYLENRNRYKEMKRSGTGLAQEDFRDKFSIDLKESLKNSYDKLSPIEAEIKAKKRTKDIMNNLAALHDPDMIAGGADKVSRMGNKGVNSSIGSQWRNPSRLALMDEKAELALETFGPDAKMNVSLERCSLNGKK